MARLKTTRERILAAALLGYLVTATIVFGLSVYDGASPWRSRILLGLISGLVVGGLLNVPGTVAWIIMHRRGAGLLGSVICGGVIGTAYAAALSISVLLTMPYRLLVLSLGSAVIIMIGAAIGAMISALTWWVAYPRKLNANPADAFV